MLLEKENRTFASAGVQEVARATIKTSPKIFNFFADSTYANKPRAICRELVANAFDSHVMAGKADVPVEVWLPTLLDPVFRVRDQGLGMSHEFMMNQFMCYADGSTKDSSNIAIGGFGIGSKSPFSYVDTYTVSSIFDGVESAYSVFKDTDGIPSIGLLGQRETDQPNGVEVSFPVKQDDFLKFENAAFEALRYFEPLPRIINATEGAFNPPKYVTRGKMWGMRSEAGALNIIMGGIMYPVDASNLIYKFDEDTPARKLLNYGLDLRVPIGTCSVALSREALSYNDHTIEGLKKACEDVIEEVAATFATMFEKYDTPWEAATALYEEAGPSKYSDRANFLKEHAKWRGKPLGVSLDMPMLIPPKKDEKYGRRGFATWEILGVDDRRGRRGRVAKIGSAKWETPSDAFTPGRFGYVLIDNLPQKPKFKAIKKIKEFCEELEHDVLVIRPWDEEGNIDIEALLEGLGSPPEDMVVLTSDLPEPIMTRAPRGSTWTDRPKVRMFTYNGERQKRGHWSQPDIRIAPEREGVEEIPYAEQPEDGILVVMENFIPPYDDIRSKVDVGLLSWHELLFVNSGDAKKLKKKDFESYDRVFERRKKDALAEYPELAIRLAVSNATELRSTFDFFRRHPNVDFTSRKPLGAIFKLYKEYVEPLNEAQRLLAPLVEPKLPARIKPQELIEKLKTKQWKAWRLMQCLPHVMDEEDMSLFLENL